MLLLWHGFDDDEDITSPVTFGGGMAIPLRKRKKPVDDDETIILISQQLAQIFWKKDD